MDGADDEKGVKPTIAFVGMRNCEIQKVSLQWAHYPVFGNRVSSQPGFLRLIATEKNIIELCDPSIRELSEFADLRN